MQVIILLGRQGCGKGTQAKFLTKDFGFSYIGSGELLRNFYEGEHFSARKVKEVLNKGRYLPSAFIFFIWMEVLEKLKQRQSLKGILFDGSPRMLLEAQLLDQALEWYEWPRPSVILIEISREEAFNRLTKRRMCEKCARVIPLNEETEALTNCQTCGGKLIVRPDDTPDAINSRLDLFEEETLPVIEYYKAKGVLKTVNGEQGIERVYSAIKFLISN